MRRFEFIGACLTATIAVLSGPTHAAVGINFDSLQNNELVNDYYNGGFGSLGSGPGPNYGVTFANADVLNEDINNEGLLVTAPNSITFLSGSGAIMDVAAGFTTGLSFNYSTPFFTGIVTVWSGLDGAGTELASIALPLTSDGAGHDGCNGHNYCPLYPIGVTFSGIAKSVNFSGTPASVVYDDITLGSAAPITGGVPEPSTWAMLVIGFAGVGALTQIRARRLLAAAPA
jgi:hypothetical protein